MDKILVFKSVFGILAFLVIYTYIGYAPIVLLLIQLKKLFYKKNANNPINIQQVYKNAPEITLIIPCYNEREWLPTKIENCKALLYPSDKLKILFVTDGSTDGSETFLETIQGVSVIHKKERSGKTGAMLHGISKAQSPFIAFTDANTILNTDALLYLMAEFTNENIGCVAGEKRVLALGEMAGEGESIYWKYESWLKKLDAELNSCVGAAGELFAIKRADAPIIPMDTILDDLTISLSIASHGKKIAYCSQAYAIEGPSASLLDEWKRKKRIATGGFQLMFRYPKFLNAFKHPLFSFQYFSRRIMRWFIGPYALVLLLIINFFLLKVGLFFQITFLLQMLFYGMAILGCLFSLIKVRIGIFYLPFYFVFMNVAAIQGLFTYFFSKQTAVWEKANRKK